MPNERILSKRTRSKVKKMAVINALVTLIFAAINLLDVAPVYNHIFLVIVLVTCGIATVSALLLYMCPINEWNHDGT